MYHAIRNPGAPGRNTRQPSSVLRPLHLSRTLYKSTLFMQNKPNLLDAKMNVKSYNTEDYENETAFRPKKTNPISSKAKMNVKSIAGKSGHTLLIEQIHIGNSGGQYPPGFR